MPKRKPVARKRAPRKPKPPVAPPKTSLVPRWLIIGIIVLALVMWVASIVYSAANPKWPVPASVHGVVIAVVTGVLGFVAVSRKTDGG